MKALLAGLLIGLALSSRCPADSTADATPPVAESSVVQPGRGFNLGSMLEGYAHADWRNIVHEDYFHLIADAGFTVIRLPIGWFAHIGPAPDYTIDPEFLSKIDWIESEALKNKLSIILDYHDDDELMNNPSANEPRYLATWKQIAEHFKDAPSPVLFELLNEPQAKMDAPTWNALLVKALAVVRASNPTRTVVVGPVQYNSIGQLDKLVLPEADTHLLVTIHFYDPMTFTHQGASWIKGSEKWLGNTWTATDAQQREVTKAFDKAAAWGAAHHRPLFLGEFGAFQTGDMDSRARWIAFVARAAEARGFSWTYWEFCQGFGAYDPQANAWREPLLKALQGK